MESKPEGILDLLNRKREAEEKKHSPVVAAVKNRGHSRASKPRAEAASDGGFMTPGRIRATIERSRRLREEGRKNPRPISLTRTASQRHDTSVTGIVYRTLNCALSPWICEDLDLLVGDMLAPSIEDGRLVLTPIRKER